MLTFCNFPSSGLIRLGGEGEGEGGADRFQGSSKGLEVEKGSFSIDEGATATPHQNIKNEIGWFQTEENWVRVHLFWDFLRARPLETCERY